VLFYVLFVCKCVLPLGDNPIAVNKYIISTVDTVACPPYRERGMSKVIKRSRKEGKEGMKEESKDSQLIRSCCRSFLLSKMKI